MDHSGPACFSIVAAPCLHTHTSQMRSEMAKLQSRLKSKDAELRNQARLMEAAQGSHSQAVSGLAAREDLARR